jgi:hypothetical protein
MSLYPRELKLLVRCLSRYKEGYTLEQIASKTVSSKGVVQQARFLMNCKPQYWEKVVNGSQSLGATYRECRDRQTNSFEG